MLLHIAHHYYGRVEVVPDLCHVATQFVCVWYFPLLPRRSDLFVKVGPAQWTTQQVRLSGKSIAFAYLRGVLWFFVISTTCGAVESLVGGVPNDSRAIVPVWCAMLGVAALGLLLLRQLSRASYAQRERFSQLPGIPPRVAAALCDESFEPTGYEPEPAHPRRAEMSPIRSVARQAAGPCRDTTPHAGPVPATMLRRGCAWFLDGVVLLLLYVVSIAALFGLAEQRPRWAPRIMRSMDAVALLLPLVIGLAYNVALPASPLSATLGKRLLGLRVLNLHGKRIGLGAALVREVIKYPGLFVWHFVMNVEIRGVTLYDPHSNRYPHDLAARTQVLRVPHGHSGTGPY